MLLKYIKYARKCSLSFWNIRPHSLFFSFFEQKVTGAKVDANAPPKVCLVNSIFLRPYFIVAVEMQSAC